MIRWRGVICGLGMLALAACGSDDDSMPTAPSPPGGNTVNIAIAQGAEFRQADAFGTNPLNVPVGSTVVWVNNDITAHNPISDTGAFSVPSIRSSGGQGSVSFSAAGTFPYHCGVHPNMVGTIVVQ